MKHDLALADHVAPWLRAAIARRRRARRFAAVVITLALSLLFVAAVAAIF